MDNAKKVTVYDLNNEPHRMTHLNARDMMQHNGWTLQPVDRAAMQRAQEQADAVDQQVSENPAYISSIEKELNGKSKAEMIAFASERYGLRIDGRKGEAEVITLILEAAAASAPKSGEAEAGTEENDDDDEKGNESE